jgi:hypothetical protein
VVEKFFMTRCVCGGKNIAKKKGEKISKKSTEKHKKQKRREKNA